MTDSLKIGLVHLEVQYKEHQQNRNALVQLNEQAASQGAKIIVNTEMAVSGYSFKNRQDVTPYTEGASGLTVSALAQIARKYEAYIAVGLPERDEITGIMYNSAFVLSPGGSVVCRYRKINGEARWACPGSGNQNAVFDTPWGKVGMLICSDSYYGLIPRTLAMNGADMILIPSNWPPSGLDPVDMWQARALENGVVVAACNRTGQDCMMDCTQARSCVISPQGEVLLAESSEDSAIFMAEVPLNSHGVLDSASRQAIMESRRPQYYGDICLDIRMIQDMTAWHDLPQPGQTRISCIQGNASEESILNKVEEVVQLDKGENIPHLILLPKNFVRDQPEEIIQGLSKKWNVGVAGVVQPKGGASMAFFASPENATRIAPFTSAAQNSSEAMQPLSHGCVHAAFVEQDALTHPEVSVSLAKQGCDLVLISESALSSEDHLLMGSRTLDRLALAASHGGGACIMQPPEGHGAWQVAEADNGVCTLVLDSAPLRTKRFQERINYPLLLQQK